jgi:hypothetical protein
MLALTTGQVMGTDTARTRAIRELDRFFKGGFCDFVVDNCTVESYSVMFVIDAEDPTSNIIVWEYKMVDRLSNEVIVSIDDETGMIIRLIYQLGKGTLHQAGSGGGSPTGMSEDDIRAAAAHISEMMTSYYGTPVRLGDFMLSGNIAYYRGDMYNAGAVIPMYGVVRANSFTINERV